MLIADKVELAYARIKNSNRPEIWIHVRDKSEVLKEAKDLDKRKEAGENLNLFGVLVAVKDNIDVAGIPTTAACPSYSYVPKNDATAVIRLKEAGALIIGKTNLDQFATGLVGTRSPYGAVRNSIKPEYISGGSSSGSAVSVALSMVDIALGTDTAGSGRVPAALNGIYGIKPTVGLIPTTGVVPACRSLDVVTVFTRELNLGELAVETMSGPDGSDPFARAINRTSSIQSVNPKVVIPTKNHLADLADGWVEAFMKTVDRLKSTGVEVIEADIEPLLEAASMLYGKSFVAERTSAVGNFIKNNQNLIGSEIDPTVAKIVSAGESKTAVELFNDQVELKRLGMEGKKVLEGAIALLTPTTTWHPKIEEVAEDPIGANARMGKFTNFANLLDFSSLAVPAGMVDGLPFGVMFTGPASMDSSLIELADRLVNSNIEIMVVGAHLYGQPLNYQLVSAGGSFVREVKTAKNYRMFALEGTPAKPGLQRVESGGSSIVGEVWSLPAAGFGNFVAALPQPMAIGKILLDDGSTVSGFQAEPIATNSSKDISEFGGWKKYLESLKN